MNIVFLSEQGFIGKVPRNHNNMRTEYGWMAMLDAFHLPYAEVLNPESSYIGVIDTADLVVFIPSKSHPELLQIAYQMKDKNIAIMQEGPNYLWQDWGLQHQLLFLGIVKNIAKIVFVHNEKDKKYFEGLTNKPVVVLRTVNYVDDFSEARKDHSSIERVLVGGTACSWYGGMNSQEVARSIVGVKEIIVPKMGRTQTNEPSIMNMLDNRIQYLDYMSLDKFMGVIASSDLVIHLMPTAAAGSLSLNAAMVGVPCIGNKDDDTQRLLFPDLSIDVTDLKTAKALCKKLNEDKEYYDSVVAKALNTLNEFNIENKRAEYVDKIQAILLGISN